MNLEESVDTMTRNIISILIVIATIVGVVLVYRYAETSGTSSADKQLCQATQGLRGRYLDNGVDCSKYGG